MKRVLLILIILLFGATAIAYSFNVIQVSPSRGNNIVNIVSSPTNALAAVHATGVSSVHEKVPITSINDIITRIPYICGTTTKVITLHLSPRTIILPYAINGTTSYDTYVLPGTTIVKTIVPVCQYFSRHSELPVQGIITGKKKYTSNPLGIISLPVITSHDTRKE